MVMLGAECAADLAVLKWVDGVKFFEINSGRSSSFSTRISLDLFSAVNAVERVGNLSVPFFQHPDIPMIRATVFALTVWVFDSVIRIGGCHA